MRTEFELKIKFPVERVYKLNNLIEQKNIWFSEIKEAQTEIYNEFKEKINFIS